MDLSNLMGGLTGAANAAGQDPSAAVASAQQLIDEHGGVDGLLQKLRAAGLGNVVDSWVSTGSNQPVQPDQLGQALGPDTMNRLSASSGISIQSLLPLLAGILPLLINHLTPTGQAPKPGEASNQPDLGGLLGGLLGGAGGLGGILGGR